MPVPTKNEAVAPLHLNQHHSATQDCYSLQYAGFSATTGCNWFGLGVFCPASVTAQLPQYRTNNIWGLKMTTGNKSALNAVRIGLLAGLSTTALMLAMASAQAQTVTATGTPGGVADAVTTNLGVIEAGGTPITGLVLTTTAGITTAAGNVTTTTGNITSGGTLGATGLSTLAAALPPQVVPSLPRRVASLPRRVVSLPGRVISLPRRVISLRAGPSARPASPP